jgi:hypothetical protein
MFQFNLQTKVNAAPFANDGHVNSIKQNALVVSETKKFKMADTPPMSMNLKTGMLLIGTAEWSLSQAMAEPRYARMLTMKGSSLPAALAALEKEGVPAAWLSAAEMQSWGDPKKVLSVLENAYMQLYLSSECQAHEKYFIEKSLEKFIGSHVRNFDGGTATVLGKSINIFLDPVLYKNLVIVLSAMVKAKVEVRAPAFMINRSFYEAMANRTPDQLQPPVVSEVKTVRDTNGREYSQTIYAQDFQNQPAEKKALALALAYVGGQLGLVDESGSPGNPKKLDIGRWRLEVQSIQLMELAKTKVLKQLAQDPKPKNWDKLCGDLMQALNTQGHSPQTHLRYLYALLIVKENLVHTSGNQSAFQNQKVIDFICQEGVFTHAEAVQVSDLANAIYGNAYLYDEAPDVDVNTTRSLRLILESHIETNQVGLMSLNRNLKLAEDSRRLSNRSNQYQESVKFYRRLMGSAVDRLMQDHFKNLPKAMRNPIVSQYAAQISDLQKHIKDAVENEAFDRSYQLAESLWRLEVELEQQLQAEAYRIYERESTQALQIHTGKKIMDQVIDTNRVGVLGKAKALFQSHVTQQSKMRQLAFIYADLSDQPEKQMKLLNDLFPNQKTPPHIKEDFVRYVAFNQLREMTDMTHELSTASDASVKKSQEFLFEIGAVMAGGLAVEAVSGGLATPLVALRVASLARYLTYAGVDARLVRTLLASGRLMTAAGVFHTTSAGISEGVSGYAGQRSQADWSPQGFARSFGNFAVFGAAGKLSVSLETWARVIRQPALQGLIKQGVRLTPEFTAMVALEYSTQLSGRDGIVRDDVKVNVLTEAMVHSAQFMIGIRGAHLPVKVSKHMVNTANLRKLEAAKVQGEFRREYDLYLTEMEARHQKALEPYRNATFKEINPENIESLNAKAREHIDKMGKALKMKTALGGSLLIKKSETGEILSTAIAEPGKPMDVDVRLFVDNDPTAINRVRKYLHETYPADMRMPGSPIAEKDQSKIFAGKSAMLFRFTTKDGLEFEVQVRPSKEFDFIYVGGAETRLNQLTPEQLLRYVRLKKALKSDKLAYKALKEVDQKLLNKYYLKKNSYELPARYKPYFEIPRTDIELQHIRDVSENLEQLKQMYYVHAEKVLGSRNIVCPDLAKEILPGYDGLNAAEYHEAASGLSKIIYHDLLTQNKSGNNTVVFTAGGPGSGKTSGLNAAKKNGYDVGGYTALFDTTLSSFKSSHKKISEAIKHGNKVKVIWVYRDPLEAFRAGVIPRIRLEGRVFRIKDHVRIHLAAMGVIAELKASFGDALNVTFIDNTGPQGTAKQVQASALKIHSYTRHQLTELCKQEAKIAYDQGRLTAQEYAEMLKE